MNAKEKVLFITIWGMILLGVGLWKFRVKSPAASGSPIQVVLTPELEGFFSSATLVSEDNDTYKIKFNVQPNYLASLSGDPTKLHLKYGLLVNDKTAYENTLAVTVAPHRNDLSTNLPNPMKVSTKTISLSLAR